MAERIPTLEELYESLDVRGHKVEILDGRIVVSAAPIKLHNRIVTWLADSLRDVRAERDWDRLTHGTVDLPESSERIQPDLFVCPADDSTDGDWLIQAAEIVLAAEVVSPSSRRDDYEVKRAGCANSGIPLYLIIDWRAETITLYSDPGERGYRRMISVSTGEKLELPDPFMITLDTATMPAPNRAP